MTCLCGRPLGGDAICPGCAHALQVAMGDISAYWCDLDTVKGRRTRYGGTGGGRGGEKPLPIDARFAHWSDDGSRMEEAVRSTMSAWARVVMEERPQIYAPTHPVCLHVSCSVARRSHWPADNIPSVCRFLLGHADWIRTQHWAPVILDELTDAAEQMRRMVDRPADRWYAGPCGECGSGLYARAGAYEIACKDCTTITLVQDRRTTLLKEAADRLVPANLIARAVSWLGEDPLTSAKVRLWAYRKQLQVREYVIPIGEVGPVCNLRPLYRLGDACDLMAMGDRRRKTGAA